MRMSGRTQHMVNYAWQGPPISLSAPQIPLQIISVREQLFHVAPQGASKRENTHTHQTQWQEPVLFNCFSGRAPDPFYNGGLVRNIKHRHKRTQARKTKHHTHQKQWPEHTTFNYFFGCAPNLSKTAAWR